MPPAPTTPLSAISRPRTRETAPTTPQTVVDRVRLAPLTTWETFEAAHRAAHRVREDYLHPGYRRRPSLSRAVRAALQPHHALFLPANNMLARTRYARLIGEGLERCALALGPDVPLFFVTLIDRRHTVRLRLGAEFNVRSLIGWVHEVLRGASYVGMVEAAYFSNLRLPPSRARRYLSWHCHMVLWGCTEAEVADLCAAINWRTRTVVPGRHAADYRLIQLEEVFGQGLYLAKGQLSEYRAWPLSENVVDRTTGDKVRVLTGKWEMGKRPLRPGDAVHLCRAFAGRYIDDLSFAAGAGRPVLKDINRLALAEFDRWEARQSYTQAAARRRAAG